MVIVEVMYQEALLYISFCLSLFLVSHSSFFKSYNVNKYNNVLKKLHRPFHIAIHTFYLKKVKCIFKKAKNATLKKWASNLVYQIIYTWIPKFDFLVYSCTDSIFNH